MASEVAGVWVRNVPANNFFNIERHSSSGPAGGGGALYLEVPTTVVPALLELLGRDPATSLEGEFAVDARVIGAPATSAPLVWDKKTGNRMRLFQNRQSGSDVRHPAWRAGRGFPAAPDGVGSTNEAAQYIAEGLRVYVVRTRAEGYFAGFLVGGYPADWPDNPDLRALFTGAGGVRHFTSGLYLEPGDQNRPFRTEPGGAAPARGGIIDPGEVVPLAPEGAAGTFPYASPETRDAVDRIAIDRALEYAVRRFPGAQVTAMPHNNPGYDIRVSDESGTIRYLEVKGTTLPTPRFYLSENERRFSVENGELFTLVVFYEVDLETETARHHDRDGPIQPTDFNLEVLQWLGTLEE